MQEGLRPEVIQRERAIAAQRYRRQNMAVATLAAMALIIMLLVASNVGGEAAVTGVLITYAISLPVAGLLLWLGAVFWWGVDCTLPVHALRVAALNAVSLCALFVCVAVGMPGIITFAIVIALMVLILRGMFDLDGPESVVAALVLLFTPYVLSMLVALL